MGVIYQHPETGNRLALGIDGLRRMARWLVSQGYELIRPQGFDPFPPPRDDLLELPGVNDEIAAALNAVGFESFDDLRAADDETLLAISGIGPGRLRMIREALGEA